MSARDAEERPATSLPIPLTVTELDIDSVVEQLCHEGGDLVWHAERVPCAEPLPSRAAVIEIVEALRSVLFPGYFGDSELRPETLRYHLGHTLDRVQRGLQQQVRRGLAFICLVEECSQRCAECDERARSLTAAFLQRLPQIRHLLATDVQAAYEGDPAATCADEPAFWLYSSVSTGAFQSGSEARERTPEPSPNRPCSKPGGRHGHGAAARIGLAPRRSLGVRKR